MTFSIDLSTDVARALEEHARRAGLTVADFAAGILADAVGNRREMSVNPCAEIATRLAALDRIGSYDKRLCAGLPPLSDEAMSRESIYEGRGQ